MSTAFYTETSFNGKALGGSVALHAALLTWALFTASSYVDLPPQQMIEVTLIAESSAEPRPKPPVSEPALRTEPSETKKHASALVQTQMPAKEYEAHPANASPPTESEARQLSALSPAAGAAEAVQIVMTKPLFDAEYLRNPAPSYPAMAKRRGMEGKVMLDVTVMADGLPRNVHIAESSGFTMLDESARNAVLRWKFVPARRNEDVVEARVMVPIEFKLE